MVVKFIVEQLTPAHAPLPIFPKSPVLSSDRTTWNNIYIEHHCQPAYETPKYHYGWCIISACFVRRDPLIYQISLALKSELAATGEKLYAEPMATALAVHLLRHYTSAQPSLINSSNGLPTHKLQQSIDYILHHLATDLSVTAIANGTIAYY